METNVAPPQNLIFTVFLCQSATRHLISAPEFMVSQIAANSVSFSTHNDITKIFHFWWEKNRIFYETKELVDNLLNFNNVMSKDRVGAFVVLKSCKQNEELDTLLGSFIATSVQK